MNSKSPRALISLLLTSLLAGSLACGPGDPEPIPYEEDASDGDTPRFRVCEGDDQSECVSTVSWESGPSAPVALDHHATDIFETDDGAYLVIAGGARDSGVEMYDGIWGLPLDSEGELGAQWEDLGTLPARSGGHTMNFVDGFVYITGGRTTSSVLNTAYYASVHEDGTIGEFSQTTTLPTRIWHHQSFVRDGHLYLVGGSQGSNSVDLVHRAPLLTTGGLGEWEVMESLPAAISHQAIAARDNLVFVVGGMQGQLYEDTVLGAHFNPDGTLDSWQELKPLPQPLVTPSAAIIGNGLYIVGGLNNFNQFIGNVYRAIIDADGSLRDWEMLENALPVGRAHVHQMPTFNGRLYTVGGRTGGFTGLPSIDQTHMGVLE